ncbi:hypothetical protein COV11_00900 [Candidatus Woesearchaeota archaeon CG10_big_fil_rev_8_21_14_0_10_30_7]|nr:MAG: hypothetical protein COV11_00900 [Candidatus Woesearchaeota archaeon CG10_big_fil_rev_8_21_14_0_10_30_7]
MGSKTNFDKDLDDYLSQRSKTQFIHNVVQTFKSRSPSIQLNPDIEPYEETYREEKKESPRRGFFARLFSGEESSVEFQEIAPSRDDLKFIAQLALDNIKKLSVEEVELFKVSAEFERLKDILKKYSLIK